MATQFIGTVAVGTLLDTRGFAVGMGKLRSAASAINGPMSGTSTATRAFSTSLRTAETSMNLLSAAGRAAIGVIHGVGAALMGIGRTASVVSLTTGLVGASIVKTGFNWRKTWNQARAVTAGTADEMERLKARVFELGSSTKFTISEVAGAVDFLGKAGNTAVEQLALLPEVLDLSAASGLELPRTADLVTNIMQGLRLDPSQIGSMGDMLTATFLNSNVTLQHLADTLKKFGPITATLGADIGDVVTSIGLLGNAGIQGSEAGVHLRRMMINLSDNMSNMRTEVVDRLGLSWDQLNVQTRGFIPVMRTLSKTMIDANGKIKNAEMFGLASRLFGARAVSTALALMGQLEHGYDDLSGAVRNSAGATRAAAQKQLEGLEPFYRLQAAVERLKISVSESGVLDTFANLADKIAQYFTRMAGASEETRRLAFGILSLVTVGGPAIFVLGLLITSVARVGQAMLFLGSVFSFLLSPIGLLTAAILAVVGAAAYLGLKGVEGIKSFFDGSSPLLTALANIVLGVIGFIDAALAGDWTRAWGHAKDVIANAVTVVVLIMHTMANAFLLVMRNVVHWVNTHWEQISAGTIKALTWMFTTTEGWLVVFTLLMFRGIRNMAIGVVARIVWMMNKIWAAFVWIGVRLGASGLAGKGFWGLLWLGLKLVTFAAVKAIVAITVAFAAKFLGVFALIAVRMGVWPLFTWLVGAFVTMFGNIVKATKLWASTTMLIFRNFGLFLSIFAPILATILVNPWVVALTAVGAVLIAFAEEVKRFLWGLGSMLKTAGLWVGQGFLNGWIRIFNMALGVIDDFAQSAIRSINQVIRLINLIPGVNIQLLNEHFSVGRIGEVSIADGRTLGQAFSEGSQGLNFGDIGSKGKLVFDNLKGLVEGAFGAIKNFGEATFNFIADRVDAIGEFVWAISSGDWGKAGEVAARELNATIGEAFRFLVDVGGKLAKSVIGPASKAVIEAALGGLGYVFTELDLVLQSIKPLEDIDPDKVRDSVYGILEDAGITPPETMVDPYTNEVIPFDQGGTPEERKQSAIDFITNIVGQLRDRISSLFNADQHGDPVIPDSDRDDLVQAMNDLGLDVDQLGLTFKEIQDQYETAPTVQVPDVSTEIPSTSGASSGPSRSLSGTLSDLSLSVLVQIGDRPFEDAVVESVFSARRGGRLPSASGL